VVVQRRARHAGVRRHSLQADARIGGEQLGGCSEDELGISASIRAAGLLRET